MFVSGWGDRALLARFDPAWIADRDHRSCALQWSSRSTGPFGDVQDGFFESPCDDLPRAARLAWVRAVTAPGNRAACVVLAGSRDEGPAMREDVFGPLVARGIDLLILENPYYGLRRPEGASSASVPTVADQIQMNVASLLEALALLEWARARYERIGVAGYSMGGHMAALGGVLFGRPLAIGAFAAGACPAPIYTSGLLSRSVAFERLGPDAEGERTKLRELFERADLTRLPPPAAPRAAAIVAMEFDGYVARHQTERLRAHWRGARVRFEPAGHISGILLRRSILRDELELAFAALDGLA